LKLRLSIKAQVGLALQTDIVFYIESQNERLTTSKAIYHQLELGNTYLVGIKGWSFSELTKR
jgi:hypothetical protein